MKKRYKVCFIGGKELGKQAMKTFLSYAKYFIVSHSPDGCDFVFNLFGDRIFKKKTIDSVKYGIINFHYGKLPEYRGRFIVSHLINNGEKRTCVTAHYIDEGIDTGDIIYEKPVRIYEDDNAFTLYSRCTRKALNLFNHVLKRIVKGKRLPRRKQKGKGTYYPNKPLNNDLIDVKLPKKSERFIKATTFPPYYPYLVIDGVKHYVKNSDLDTKS